MSRRDKQAITKGQIQEKRQAKQRFFLRLTYIILFMSLIVWAWSLIHNPYFFPIKHVVIEGSYEHVNPVTLRKTIQPFLKSSLFTFDSSDLQQDLQMLPWIESASVHKRWLNKIVIVLTEKDPIARWGKGGLVTSEGEVFFPKVPKKYLNLPLIKVKASLIPQALFELNQFNMLLTDVKLRIISLKLTQRQAFTLVIALQSLSNTSHFTLYLGHDNVQTRLKRFINVYPSVFENRINEVQYVDMRYPNGMAVKWKKQSPSG